MLPPLTFNAWLRWDIVARRLPPGERLLEIGPGVGSISARLAARYDYVGVELSRDSARVARERVEASGGVIVNGTVECIDARFDVVCAFEVLEHIEKDSRAVSDWGRLLGDQGKLFLTVPAQPRLFGANDELAGHYRRYTRSTLRDTLLRGGLRVESLEMIGGPGGMALKWARDVRAARTSERTGSMKKRTLGSGRIRQPGNLAGALTWLTMLPFRSLQRPFVDTDFGSGLAAVASLP